MFRGFSVDRELNTVTWPTGADLAPEFLYEKATAQSPDELQMEAASRSPCG